MDIRIPRGRPKKDGSDTAGRKHIKQCISLLVSGSHTKHPLGNYLVEILNAALEAPPRKVGNAMRINKKPNSPIGKRTKYFDLMVNWLLVRYRNNGKNILQSNYQLAKAFRRYITNEINDDYKRPEIDNKLVEHWLEEIRPNIPLLEKIDALLTSDK
jgi:hypothetical protein